VKPSFIHDKFFFGLIVFCMISILWSSTINAEEYETKGHLESIVEAFVLEHIERRDDEHITVQVNSLNANIKLSYCESKIDISFAKGNSLSQSNAVVLQCHSEPSWNIYVPVSVQILSKVVAADRLIASGDIITEHDLVYEEYDKNKLYDGYFKDISDVVGLSVVRSIPAGTALTKRNVRQVAIIKRNQMVTLVLKTNGFEIDMVGVAKSDGYLNEVVKVLNPSSKKIIDAVVIGPARAQIT